MQQPPNLLRDYGLALGLALASVLLFWCTMLPQIRRNQELDRAYREVLERNRNAELEVERFKLQESATTDPLTMERKAREYFGDLVLPEHEIPLEEPASGVHR